jgi:hypothetical protein
VHAAMRLSIQKFLCLTSFAVAASEKVDAAVFAAEI